MQELREVEVIRRAPKNLKEKDESLFSHEFRKVLPAARTFELEDHWFYPDGLLVKPWSFWPRSESFGSKVSGITQLKIFLKILLGKLTKKAKIIQETFWVLTDEFSNGYFHWLADSLPKLFVLSDKKKNTVLIPSYGQKFSYMRDSLEILGLQAKVVDYRERIRPKKMTGVTALAPTGNYRPEYLQRLRKALLDAVAVEIEPHRRVYISRKKAPWRKVANEAILLEVLGRFGFEIFCLEDLSFRDQVKLLAETEFLIGNHGAGLTNMLFMPEGGKVMELRLEGDGANNCYYSMADALKLDYYYLLCHPHSDNLDSHTADVVANPQEFEIEIKKMIEGFYG